jgi:protein phosphatase 1L
MVQIKMMWILSLTCIQSADTKLSEKQLDFEVGICSHQGRRPYQEDEYSLRPFLRGANSSPESHFFAIFDGHAGGKCSKYLSTNLNEIFQNDPSFDTNISMALRRSYFAANEQFLKHADRLKLHDGSTGISTVLREGKLHIANVGDCRAVIVRRESSIQITNDHKPTDADEQKRISSFGGTVVNCMGVYRVNGILAVSRAFGNRTIKQVIRPEPDIFSRDLSTGDDFLVMGSDGLWDVIQNDDLNDVCYTYAVQGCKRIAEELVHSALMRGSMDNITCLVINLQRYVQKWNSIAESTERRPKSRVESYNNKATSLNSNSMKIPSITQSRSTPSEYASGDNIFPSSVNLNNSVNIHAVGNGNLFQSSMKKNLLSDTILRNVGLSKYTQAYKNFDDAKSEQTAQKSENGQEKIHRKFLTADAAASDDIDEELDMLLGSVQGRSQSSNHRFSRNSSSNGETSARYLQRRPLSTMNGQRNGASSPAVSISSNRSTESPTLSVTSREELISTIVDAAKSTTVRIGSGIRNIDLKTPLQNPDNLGSNKRKVNTRPVTRGY